MLRTAKETPTAIFAHHPPVTRLAALHNAGVDVFEAEDLNAALEALRGFETQHLMVEGGARVAQEFAVFVVVVVGVAIPPGSVGSDGRGGIGEAATHTDGFRSLFGRGHVSKVSGLA